MTEHTDQTTKPYPAAIALGWCGFILLIVLVLIRAMVEHDGFPMWSSDPFVFSPPVIGLTPTKTILLNLGVILSSCMVLTSLCMQRISIGTIRPMLLIIGFAAIVFHAYTDIETVLPGSNILAVLCTLYVASFAHKFGGLQRVIAAVVLGFAVLLVVMGAYEMFVIHPATVASYVQTRDSFLAARGWSDGSFETLAYERRLYQAEPIVWFGLTNVFASFCGACAAGLMVLGWKARTKRSFPIPVFIAAAGSFAGLLLSGAKGGLGAFVLGLGLVILANRFPMRKLDGRALVMLCCVVLAGLVGRGLIGEGLGEHSLLFRWQYMVGSIRMFIANWMSGVGPGHFQDAYAIYKPTLSPENVSSPHNLPMNLIATFGLGGIALTVMCVCTLVRIRPSSVCETNEYQQDKRKLIQATMLVVSVASVISVRFGSPAMDLNLLLIQVLGSLLWAGVAYLIVRESENDSAIRWSLFAAGSVLAIHSMIEVNASWYVSGLLVALMIGSSCTEQCPKAQCESASRFMPSLVIACLLGCLGVFGTRAQTITKWEHELALAAQPASRVAYLRSQLDSLEFSPAPFEDLREIAMELSAGSNPNASIDWIVPQLNQFEQDGRMKASEHLIAAAEIRPTHMPTFITASSQILWRASFAQGMNNAQDAQVLWDQALNLLDEGVANSTGSSGYQWIGNVWRGRADQFADNPNKGLWLANAQSAWEIAYERSPYNPHLAYKLMDLAIDRAQHDQAVRWARIALERHEQSRLDPLRGLDEDRFMRAQAIARSGMSTPTNDGP